MLKRACTFILALCLTSTAFAQTALPAGFENASRTSDIYRQTHVRCSAKYIMYSPVDLKAMRDGFAQILKMSTLDTMAIGDFFHQGGRSPRMFEFLKSPDYALALQDCFGNNQTKKYLFVKTQLDSMTDGQAAAVVAVVFVTRGAGAVLGRVVAWAPKLRWVIYGLTAALTTRAVYHAVHEVLRDATPQEKAAGEKILATPSTRSDQIRTETQQLLRDTIAEKEQRLREAKTPDEQAYLRQRITSLQASLRSIS